jgi:hypothetical protein
MTTAAPSYTTLLLAPREGDRWEVREEWQYATHRDTYVVPAGFVTDLASAPRILWAIVPPFGAYMGAAVLHDFLYSSKIVSRKDADRIFFAAMIVDGERVWRAWAMYKAVRLFGWLAWRKKG